MRDLERREQTLTLTERRELYSLEREARRSFQRGSVRILITAVCCAAIGAACNAIVWANLVQ